MVPLDRHEFDRLAELELAELPEQYQAQIANVVIAIEDNPPAGLLASHELPADLLGFYDGVPVTEGGIDSPAALDRIYLFRNNLCAMCTTTDELSHEIRVTLLHEIGHHLGIDEDRLEELGYG